MMDKNRNVEEQNRLKECRRHNHEEAKKIVAQAKKSKEIVVQIEKSSKSKGLRTIFSPIISYQVLDYVEEEIELMVMQMMIEKTTGSPSENT
jgi:hypothetical protein